MKEKQYQAPAELAALPCYASATESEGCPYCEEGYIRVTDSVGSKITIHCGVCRGTGRIPNNGTRWHSLPLTHGGPANE